MGFTGSEYMVYVLNKCMDFAQQLPNNNQMPITSIGYKARFKYPPFKNLPGISSSPGGCGLSCGETLEPEPRDFHNPPRRR